MAATADLPNPYGVPAEADRIRAPELDVPHWSENLLLWCHDGDAGTSVFTHMSRLHPDPRMWEGVLAVLRPGGEVLIDRSIGFCPDGADTGRLAAECVEPNQRWRLTFSGSAQRTTGAALAAGDRLPDAPARLELDLGFDATNPVWSLGTEAEQQDWASFHTQQGGSWSGAISIDDETIPLDCGGIRDHSVGPREYGGLLGNFWACCAFPSGRTFMAFQVWSEQLETPLSRGFLATAEEIQELTVTESPTLTAPDGTPSDVTIVLARGDGSTFEVTGEGQGSITFHLTTPIGMRFGFYGDDPSRCIDTHRPMRFEIDGEVGYGWMERIRRVGHLDGSLPPLA